MGQVPLHAKDLRKIVGASAGGTVTGVGGVSGGGAQGGIRGGPVGVGKTAGCVQAGPGSTPVCSYFQVPPG